MDFLFCPLSFKCLSPSVSIPQLLEIVFGPKSGGETLTSRVSGRKRESKVDLASIAHHLRKRLVCSDEEEEQREEEIEKREE